MKRTPIKILELKGDPYEIAYQLGQKRKRQIHRRIDYWNAYLAKRFQGKKNDLKNLEKKFYQEGFSFAQQYVEEVQALAEGADIPFSEAFRLNLTELKPYAEKCSTVIFPVQKKGKNGILIGHNEDWEPEQNDVFFLKARMPEVSYQILTYDGYIPGLSTGMNSHGLFHAVNYVLAKDIRAGVPRAFITRYLVTAKNMKNCLSWIRKCPRAFGQSIHLAEQGKYRNIEVTAKKLTLRQVKLPAFHTNHYLAKNLQTLAAPASANSLKRLAVGRKLIREIQRKRTGEFFTLKEAEYFAKQILSDRSGYPYCIWREDDGGLEKSATVATAIFSTLGTTMQVYRRQPDQTKALLMSLSRMR